ncbi:MAG: dipeptide ABC transporter ATP-binding protein [Actinomycetota bacterium]
MPGAGGFAARIRGLHVWLEREGNRNHVLRGVDLDVRAGEIVALVGESGSGKTTLGYAVQGLLDASSVPTVEGSIVVDGVEVVGADDASLRDLRRRAIGAVFQDPSLSLDPTMRVGRQLREAIADGTSTERWLERVGLPDPARCARAYPHELSGGQRQRAMIAMAAADDPVLIVADEPTTALDVTVQAQILALFGELRRSSDTAMVFVTHDLAVAGAIADRIAVMYAGRIVEDGAAATILAAPRHPYTLALLAARLGATAAREAQLPVLRGEPPASGTGLVGCAFAPRCPLADDRCRAEDPQPIATGAVSVACHRTAEVVPDLWRRVAEPWPEPSAPAAEPALVLRDIRLRYPGRRRGEEVLALDGVSLEVPAGGSVAIVGESGSGKSTLLRVAAGLVRPDAGEVRVAGEGRPQMVYQNAAASLTPWLGVEELVGERLRRTGRSRAERRALVLEALDTVGLPERLLGARPGQLSGGQRQRVAIARAIVVPPALLLCDEPTSALDVSLAAGILNLLGSLRRRFGMAMVFVTHDLAAARFVAERIVVLNRGVVVEEGAADRVIDAPEHPYTRQLLASMPERLREASA